MHVVVPHAVAFIDSSYDDTAQITPWALTLTIDLLASDGPPASVVACTSDVIATPEENDSTRPASTHTPISSGCPGRGVVARAR